MKISIFTFMCLIFINIGCGYSVENKEVSGEIITSQAEDLLWEFYTFELKKETYVSSFSKNCFVIDDPDFTNKRTPIVNESIKSGMRLIISENCEIDLFDEDGIYTFKYSDHGKFYFVEIVGDDQGDKN